MDNYVSRAKIYRENDAVSDRFVTIEPRRCERLKNSLQRIRAL